jgi:hypothetical protein
MPSVSSYRLGCVDGLDDCGGSLAQLLELHRTQRLNDQLLHHGTDWLKYVLACGPDSQRTLRRRFWGGHVLKTFWGWRDKQLPDGTVTRAGYTPENLARAAALPF